MTYDFNLIVTGVIAVAVIVALAAHYMEKRCGF